MLHFFPHSLLLESQHYELFAITQGATNTQFLYQVSIVVRAKATAHTNKSTHSLNVGSKHCKNLGDGRMAAVVSFGSNL
jgi:hypothetical protein